MTHSTDRPMDAQPATRRPALKSALTRALAVAGLVMTQVSAWIGLPQPAQAAPARVPVAAPATAPLLRAAPAAPAAPTHDQASPAISAGGNHACGIRAGALLCWGRNSNGQLGDGTTTQRTTPVTVSGQIAGWTAVSAGESHTCGIRNGALLCWGLNSSGQLGDGTTTQRTTPVTVTGMTSGVTAVSAGNNHTCAIQNGALLCWGNNGSGQLGDETTTNRTTPQVVRGMNSGVTAVTTNGTHTCAVRLGVLLCWGANANGQLGDGTVLTRTTPHMVVNIPGILATVAAGNLHTCAMWPDGSLRCWGGNGNGQIGDGTTTNRSTPTAVTGMTGGVTAAAPGGRHTCAIRDGALLCWGLNSSGQLGDGTLTQRTTPITPTLMGSGVVAASTGLTFSIALKQDRCLYAWGANGNGQLGDGTTSNRSLAQPVSGPCEWGVAASPPGAFSKSAPANSATQQPLNPTLSWSAASGTVHHYRYCVATTSCVPAIQTTALSATVLGLTPGTTYYWQVRACADALCSAFTDAGGGQWLFTTRPLPTHTGSAFMIDAGDNHACGVRNGALQCWGLNSNGQLGDGTTTQRTTPVTVSGQIAGWTAVSAGGSHTCGIRDGALLCWGRNNSGQLGDGTTTQRTTPVTVTGMTTGVMAVAAGTAHTCAIRNGALLCWGNNSHGELGIGGQYGNYSAPQPVVGMSSGVMSVWAGVNHTCAVRFGVLFCWGQNSVGQLGNATTLLRLFPQMVVNVPAALAAVAAGANHACTIWPDGSLRCWGGNGNGQIGDGTTTNRSTPTAVTGMTGGVTAAAPGGSHTCAIRNGALLCWGLNSSGQLGDGTLTQRTTPVTTSFMSNGVVAASTGSNFSIALKADGCLYAWGQNTNGQLGDGTTSNRSFPQPVSGECLWPVNVDAPGTFNKSAPADGATDQPTSPTLSWTAPTTGTVDHYRYCVATTTGCTPVTNNGTATSAALSGLTPGTTYYWQVRACANSGCAVFTDASGGHWSFTTQALPPQSGFNKVSPANGATGQPVNSLNLTWSTVSGATSYEVCFDTTLNGTCSGTWQNVGNTGSTTLNGLLAGVQYEWQVRACNIAGCNDGADSGAWWTFATLGAPGAFSKVSPANGATGVATSPTLSWNAASGAVDHYRYCVSTVTGCTPATSVGTNTSVALSGLSAGTTYFWQARACGDADCTTFTNANAGAYWSFSTIADVGSFNKVAPGNGAVNVNTATAQLQWGAASGASGYAVCLGTAVNACNIVGGGAGVYSSTGGTTLPLSGLGLQPNTTYYWQALATNGTYTTFANGGALAFWSFTTLAGAPNDAGFNKVSPAFNATNVPTQNVSFTWQPASGAVSYTVCVGAFAGDCSYSVTSVGTSAMLPGPLPAGATLVWQVTAHNTGGTVGADSGAWWPFTTVPNAPTAFSKLSPANGATGQAIGLPLVWQDASGETYYQVCAGTAIGLCNMANVTTTADTTSFDLTGLDYATTYWWQISACNAGGCAPANGGASWSFTTQNPPLPGAFQKTSPLNGTIGAPTNTAAINLQWTTSAQADGYEVCFGTQPNTCDLSGGGFQDVGNVTSRLVSQLPFSVTLQPGSTYWWQVRSYNNLTATRTLADNGASFSFTTLSVSGPGGFSKDAPVNGAFNLPTASVTLRWFAASGATSYEICVGTAANSCDALPGNAWQNVGNVLQTPIVNLNPGTTYFWQVRAVNAGGSTPANGGVWWQFTTRNANPPAEFSKVAPFHLATNVPTATAALSWNASTGATGYEVCVGSAPGLCEGSGGWVNVGDLLSWIPPALQSATTYWWQVRALGSGFSVQADGGQWWAFTTVADPPPAPEAFSKLTPVQGASGVPVSATLTWQSASGATDYQVCVGTQAGLCDVTGNWVSVAGTTYSINLNPSATYWWQVRALNGSGQTQANSGAWWHFTTAAAVSAPGAFSKSAPANAAANQPINPTLSWTAASGATGYQVCAGTLPGDCSASGGWVNVAGLSYALSGLAYDTTYWWQARAVSAGGVTFANGGVWWRFTTGNNPGSPLGAFSKTAPAHQATGVLTNATLSWNASSGATRYSVCVGTQPGLCDVMNNITTTATSLALANAQAGQTYWWQVTAYSDGQFLLADAGHWWAFTTANDTLTGPGDFQKTSPVSGTVTGSGLTLAWTASSGAVGYRVCVGTAWGLCDVVNSTTTSLSQTLSGLPPGSYWWQVTAVDANGNTTQADNGDWSLFTAQDDGIGNLDTTGETGTRKEAVPETVRMGEMVTYTIVLSNSGSLAVTARVTDTLAVSATLLSATPGYVQSGQTLAWSNVVVPAGGTATLTITVRAGSGPLPDGYTLSNDVTIGAHDGEIIRNAPAVEVRPWEAFLPIVTRGN